MIDKYPEELINIAVKGMIPKNRLGRQIIKKLHVYRDGGIDHSAQKPIEYKIKG
jgi:large subunit ribosomal protein L13